MKCRNLHRKTIDGMEFNVMARYSSPLSDSQKIDNHTNFSTLFTAVVHT